MAPLFCQNVTYFAFEYTVTLRAGSLLSYWV